MTTKAMLSAIQDYYGLQYSKGMGKMVVQYLDGHPDSLKPFLLAETLKAHSAAFKALPDVAVFESVGKEAKLAWEESAGKYMALGAPVVRPEELVTDAQLDEFASDIKSILEAKKHGAVDALVDRMKSRVIERRDAYKD